MKSRILAAVVLLVTCFGAHAKSVISIENAADTSGYPVDIARTAGLQVGAAHSMWRAMSANYSGPLFILFRTSDSTYTTINTLGRGGGADMGAINTFCGSRNANTCQVAAVCDQMHTTCKLSGGKPVNFSGVSVTVASPTVVTWTNGAGTTPANNTLIYFEYQQLAGTDQNTKMPTGLGRVLGSCSNCHTQWYCTTGVSTNTFNVYPATLTTSGTQATNAVTSSGTTLHFASVPSFVVPGLFVADTTTPSVIPANDIVASVTSTTVVLTSAVTGAGVGSGDTITFTDPRLPTCPGVSSNQVNVTGAGTATGLSAHLGQASNDLEAIDSKTNPPNLGFVSLPNGSAVPIWSSAANQIGRARANSLLPSTVPTASINRTVYGLFDTMSFGVCCGTYGIMEDVVFNKGQNNMFALGMTDSSGTGIPCTGPVASDYPCIETDLENGIFASTNAVNPTITIASPAVFTVAGSNYPNGQIVSLYSNSDTLPTGLAYQTLYYVVSSGVDGAGKFRLSTSLGGAAINTSGSQAGTHALNISPQAAQLGGFTWGLITCDSGTGAGVTSGMTFDVGNELSPIIAAVGYGSPTGWACQAADATKSGGISLGEGGDASDAHIQFLEGFVARGNMPGVYRQLFNSAVYNSLHTGAPFSGAVYSFTGGSLPSNTSFSRASCSPVVTGGCATDAEYFDAAGTTVNQFADNAVVLNTTKGYASFAKRNNYFATSSSPANQTTPSLATAQSYVLFCNGTGSVSFTDNTAVTVPASGTQTCNTGSYMDIAVTTAGTLNLTVTGSVNWADLQDNAGAATATATVTIASPGVMTVSSTNYLACDQVYLTTTGALPTGLSVNTIYYIVNPGVNTFQQANLNSTYQLATTCGGAAINTSGSQSGTHTIHHFAPGATPHIITAASVPVARQKDILSVTGASATALDGLVSSAVIEFTQSMYSDYQNSALFMAAYLGTSIANNEMIWGNLKQLFSGGSSNNSGGGSYSDLLAAPSQTKHIIGGALGQSVWSLAIDGVVSHTDPTGAGWATVRGAAGGSRYLGYDGNKGVNCNCWITRAAIYPGYLTRAQLATKTTSGAALP